MTALNDHGITPRREERWRRSILLVVLYAAPVSMVLKPTIFNDHDIWFHLRAGQWISEHGQVPFSDPFSVFGTGRPWAAYSWLFELLVYGAYRILGLAGIAALTVALALAISAVLHRLISGFQPSFTKTVFLTAAGLFSMTPFFSPRPWLFTILFFIIEFTIVLEARETGDGRRLWYLLPLFCLWSNLHIQFLYGLFLLALAAAESFFSRAAGPFSEPQSLPPGRWVLVLTGCILATLVNPYHFRLYGVIYDYARQSGHLKYIMEFQPLSFRDYHSFLVLFIALAGAYGMGRYRRISPFQVLLLISAAIISFRSVRDSWFIVIVALGLVAAEDDGSEANRFRVSKRLWLLHAVAVLIVLSGVARIRGISGLSLETAIAAAFPSEAVRAIDQRGYPGPMFNYYDWGGYLIWCLPSIPVSIDGRTHLHGEERIARSIATWNGFSGWESDPELSRAGLVIGPSNLALISLLRKDTRYELAYQDAVATVFVARNGTGVVK